MDTFDRDYRPRLEKLPTTAISDAMEKHGLRGHPLGIRPMWEGAPKMVGRAVTVKFIAAGVTKSKRHGSIQAIDMAREGDVIVVDNAGRMDTNSWGGVLTAAAKVKKLAGVVADGAVRDIDEIMEFDFPVYARGNIVLTARGRTIEESTNAMVSIGSVQVRPGDIVVADRSGVVFIPAEHLDAVLAGAEEIQALETSMINDLLGGMNVLEMDAKYSYEQMLERKKG